jgi:nickel transport protein
LNARKSLSEWNGIILVVCLFLLALVCLMTVKAHAHKVNLFAYVEGDKVVVEGYFSAKSKAQDCVVEVYDEIGKKIHEGKTDQNGVYSFKLAELPPFTGALKIVLEAGMGHKAEYTLSASDLPASPKKDEPPKEQAPKNKSDAPKQKSEAPKEPSTAAPVQIFDQTALAAALEATIDKKLDPIVKMLGRQEKLLLEEKQGGPRINDIFVGIGFSLCKSSAIFLSRSSGTGTIPLFGSMVQKG